MSSTFSKERRRGGDANATLYLTLPMICSDAQHRDHFIMHQSIPNSSGAPPPGQPRGICSSCQSRGWGIRNFVAARGLGISPKEKRLPPRALLRMKFSVFTRNFTTNSQEYEVIIQLVPFLKISLHLLS